MDIITYCTCRPVDYKARLKKSQESVYEGLMPSGQIGITVGKTPQLCARLGLAVL